MKNTPIRAHHIFKHINRKEKAMFHLHQAYLSSDNVAITFEQSSVDGEIIFIGKYLRKYNQIMEGSDQT